MVTMLAMRIDTVDTPNLTTEFYKKNIKKRAFPQKQTLHNAVIAFTIMGAIIFSIDFILMCALYSAESIKENGFSLSQIQFAFDDYALHCVKHVLYTLIAAGSFTLLMHYFAKRSSHKITMVRLYKS